MTMQTVERRLELLKLEGEGYSQNEIVKLLTKQFHRSPRSIRYDFQQRGKWQPKLSSLDDPQKVLMQVVNRYDQVIRQAAYKFRTTRNEYVQMGCLGLIAKVNEKLSVMLLPEVHAVAASKVIPIVKVEMWRPNSASSTE